MPADPENSVTANNERQAEIEAVAQIIEKWCKRDMPTAYDCAREILDRARDARHADELRSPTTLGLPTKRECGVETQDLGEPIGPARSPQGEDHEAGTRQKAYDSAAQVAYDMDVPLRIRDMEVVRAMVDAALSVAPSPARDARHGTTTAEERPPSE